MNSKKGNKRANQNRLFFLVCVVVGELILSLLLYASTIEGTWKGPLYDGKESDTNLPLLFIVGTHILSL